jgi:hypothetical protein
MFAVFYDRYIAESRIRRISHLQHAVTCKTGGVLLAMEDHGAVYEDDGNSNLMLAESMKNVA